MEQLRQEFIEIYHSPKTKHWDVVGLDALYQEIDALEEDPTEERLYKVGIQASKIRDLLCRIDLPDAHVVHQERNMRTIAEFTAVFADRTSDQNCADAAVYFFRKHRHHQYPLAPFVTFYMRVVMRLCVKMTGDERVKRMLADL